MTAIRRDSDTKRILVDLPTEIKELEQSLFHKRAQYADLNNRTNPISSLPRETLSNIFEIAYFSLRQSRSLNETGLRFEHIISRVSRHWRDIAINLSHLWTSIAASRGASTTNLAIYLQRSGAQPLEVYMDFGYKHQRLRDKSVGPIIDTIIPHITRWRRLVLSVNLSSLSIIQSYLFNLEVPSLEELEIDWKGSLEELRTIDLHFGIFRGGAPKLKSLQMFDMTLEQIRPPLTALTDLHIYGPCNIFMPFNCESGMLPNLRSLTIDGGDFEDNVLGGPIQNAEVPSLHTVRIFNLYQKIHGILTSLQAPLLDSLILGGIYECDGYGWGWEGVLVFPALRSLDLWDVSVDITSIRTILASCPTITELGLDFTCTTVLQLLAKEVQTLLKDLRHLRIVSSPYPSHPGDFARFPSLISTIVSSTGHQIKTVEVDLELWTALAEQGILESLQNRVQVVLYPLRPDLALAPAPRVPYVA